MATARGDITLWDVLSGLPMAELASLDIPLECLALSAQGRALAAAGSDGTLWLRRLSLQAAPRPLGPRVHSAASAVFGSGHVANTVLGSGQRLFDWLRRVALL